MIELLNIDCISTLYHGDCLVEMDKIADKSVDMILCDLPYGTTACKWDVIIPFESLWKQYERVIKDNGAIVLTASQPFTSNLIMSNPKYFKYDLTWDKKLSSGFLNANRMPLRRHEDVCVFYMKQPTYNPQFLFGEPYGKRSRKPVEERQYGKHKGTPEIDNTDGKRYPTSILEISNANRNKEGLHPTQKPIELMEYMVKTYTNEGNTVLDNCMGSGTTGVACKNLNRKFIGIEQDEKYFDIAVKRIKEQTAQLKIAIC